MSQLDTAIYFPLFFWFLAGVITFYFFVLCWVVPSLYKALRLRDIFIKNLGKGVFMKVGALYVLRKFISFKLFTYRASDYYLYLCKKLKK